MIHDLMLIRLMNGGTLPKEYLEMSESDSLDCLDVCCQKLTSKIEDIEATVKKNWEWHYAQDKSFGERLMKLETFASNWEEMLINFENIKNDILSINGQLEGLSEHIEELQALDSANSERINDLENVQPEHRLIKLETFVAEWKKMPRWDLKECVDMVNDHNHRVKDIEYRLNAIVALPNELDIRLQDVERLVHKSPGETLNWCVEHIKYLLANIISPSAAEMLVETNMKNIFEHIDSIKHKIGMETKATCSVCNGAGIFEGTYTCPKCDGDGKYGN